MDGMLWEYAEAYQELKDLSESYNVTELLPKEFGYQVAQGYYVFTSFDAVQDLPQCRDLEMYVDSIDIVNELQEQLNFNDNYMEWLNGVANSEDEEMACLTTVTTLRQQVEQIVKVKDETEREIDKMMEELYNGYRMYNDAQDQVMEYAEYAASMVEEFIYM